MVAAGLEGVSEHRRRNVVLAVLCTAAATNMIALSAMNVALPQMQRDLGLTGAHASWLISAYALGMGGFVLLGGRAADTFGRRAVFAAGMTVFGASAALCAAISSGWAVIGLRGLQGLGAALSISAGLSILMETFEDGSERHRALSAWAVSGSIGSASGFIAGGVLTTLLGWQWIFIATAALSFAIAGLSFGVFDGTAASPDAGLDLPGAAAVTSALLLLVFAFTSGSQGGWTSPATTYAAVAGVALLALSVRIELTVANPLVPMGWLVRPQFVVAMGINASMQGLYIGGVLLMSLYLQQVLGYSALVTGLCLLFLNLGSFVGARSSPRVMGRLGSRWNLLGAYALFSASALWLARVPSHGSFAVDVLPATVAFGLACSSISVLGTVFAFREVARGEGGLVAGILNSSRQMGQAIGASVVTTVAAVHGSGRGHEALASSSGIRTAWLIVLGVVAASAVVSLALRPVAPHEASPLPIPTAEAGG